MCTPCSYSQLKEQCRDAQKTITGQIAQQFSKVKKSTNFNQITEQLKSSQNKVLELSKLLNQLSVKERTESICPKLINGSIVTVTIVAGAADIALWIVEKAVPSQNTWITWVQLPLKIFASAGMTISIIGWGACDLKEGLDEKKIKRLLDDNLKAILEANTLSDLASKIEALKDDNLESQDLQLKRCKDSYCQLSKKTQETLLKKEFFSRVFKKFCPEHDLTKVINYAENKKNHLTVHKKSFKRDVTNDLEENEGVKNDPSVKELLDILNRYQEELDGFGLLELNEEIPLNIKDNTKKTLISVH